MPTAAAAIITTAAQQLHHEDERSGTTTTTDPTDPTAGQQQQQQQPPPENDSESSSSSVKFTRATPIPNDTDHIRIMFLRLLTIDLFQSGGNRRFFFFKTFSGVFFWMLYTVGFFTGSQFDDGGGGSGSGTVVSANNGTDYYVYPPTNFSYPTAIVMGGNDDNDGGGAFTKQVSSYVNSSFGDTTTVLLASYDNNKSEFESYCGQVAVNRTDITCAYIYGDGEYVNNNEIMPSFDLYYGGGAYAPHPSSPSSVVLGTQHAINQGISFALSSSSSLINTSSKYAAASQIQNTPIPYENYIGNKPVSVVTAASVGGLMVLAVMLMQFFAVTPIVQENMKEIKVAFLRVGVNEYTYYTNWILYLSFWSLLTAGAFTAVSIGWNLYRLSNGLLVYMSHFLAFAFSNIWLVWMGNITQSEEYASGLPLLGALLSLAISVPLVAIDLTKYTTILSVLCVVSPYIGMVEYNAIYVSYDYVGKGIGIRFGNGTIQQSGLLGCLLGQLGGIVLWTLLLWIWVQRKTKFNNPIPPVPPSDSSLSSKIRRFLQRVPIVRRFAGGRGGESDEAAATTAPSERQTSVDPSNFEPLPPDADVLLRVTGLEQTFAGDNRGDENKKVLRGLDMEVCRGEVLGFLGHNGSGT